MSLLHSPIGIIDNSQQLNLCTRVVSTGIEVSNLVYEVQLIVDLHKVIKLKIQPVPQSQIHVARHLLTITTMYLIEPSLPKYFVYPQRILVLLFIDNVNLLWYSIIKTKTAIYVRKIVILGN